MKNVKKTLGITKNLIKREINYHRIRPTKLLLFLTYRCTSRCKTCIMWQRETTDAELSFQEWKYVVDSACRYKIQNVEMFGGDALLRKTVLIPLVAYCREKGIPQVDLATNSNLLDEQTARSLIHAGLTTLFMSIDGTEQLHDHVRGVPGSFEKVKHGIENIVKYRNGRQNPRLITTCTVSSLNIHGIEKVADFAESMGADETAFEYLGEFPKESLQKSSVNNILPSPYYVSQDSSLLLNREDAILLKHKLEIIKTRFRKSKLRITTRNIDVLDIEHLVHGTLPFKKCYICRYMITVDPYGNILPCLFFNNYHLGNIRETAFSAIWKNKLHRDFIARAGRAEICRHCILGAERNSSFMQAMKKSYRTIINEEAPDGNAYQIPVSPQ